MAELPSFAIPVSCPQCQQQVSVVITLTSVEPDAEANAYGVASYLIRATCYDDTALRQHLARHERAPETSGPVHCAGCGMLIERAPTSVIADWRHKGTGFAYCWPGEPARGVATP